jgi:hypothetical protein
MAPYEVIETTKGSMDVSLLVKRAGTVDNDVELTHWVEYWLPGAPAHPECAHRLEMPSRMCVLCPAELVHRSADVTLKQATVFAEGTAHSFA